MEKEEKYLICIHLLVCSKCLDRFVTSSNPIDKLLCLFYRTGTNRSNLVHDVVDIAAGIFAFIDSFEQMGGNGNLTSLDQLISPIAK